MAAKRYYYSDTITDFLQKEDMVVIGKLALAYSHDINDETKMSWLEELRVMRSVLKNYKNRGSVYFEYNIPRMGRRADVIVLIDDVVFVLEFKTRKSKFTHEAVTQVWDYALDLKNFQEAETELLYRFLLLHLRKTRTARLNFRILRTLYTILCR